MFPTLSLVFYLIGAFVLMLFMYLIARFYRIKLDPNTPVAGFLSAMVTLIMAITGILIGDNGPGEQLFVDVSLFGTGVLGAWNSIALHVRMKRVYK